MPTQDLAPDLARAHFSRKRDACLVFASGDVLYGFGIGARGSAVGELCFNTAMTGYQEILTDPSYAGQIITFTFPHIGNTGINDEDIEALDMDSAGHALGLVVHADLTLPSNWRSVQSFDGWLKKRNMIGICGIDTRALTLHIREHGMPNVVIAFDEEQKFDIPKLKNQAREWHGLAGADLVPDVSSHAQCSWTENAWNSQNISQHTTGQSHVVVIDYGIKRNILRQLVRAGARVTVVPSTATTADILMLKPDGVFLSNGPGDPAETGKYAVPVIQNILARQIPLFGICLGHQLLALAIGGQTLKMLQGHHGANHPVHDLTSGKVEITSMNHGFAVDRKSLPDTATETHVSLFDRTNAGLSLKDAPAFSVQHHPEASPGPEDSHYLFDRFMTMIASAKKVAA